ncbi:MAG: CoA transferase subunit A [Promethearchaeota archaeon]
MPEPVVEDKRISLKEVTKKIPNGAHIAWGGFGYQRPPEAFAMELIRQKKRGLRIYTCGSEHDLDILVGAEVCLEFEVAFFAIEALGLAPNLRRRTKEGKVRFEDYSNLSMALRFLGGALNVPFMPIRHLLGSDMLTKARLRKDKAKVIDCPFTGKPIALLPSVQADFGVICAQRVDPEGNTQIFGIKGEDNEIARCAKTTIVFAEEIISNEEIRRNPDLTMIPGLYVDYVVEVPFGSWPMQVYGYYDYDLPHLQMYVQQCRTEEGWQEYLEDWILGVGSHEGLLKKIGEKRLKALRADKVRGY